MADRLQDWEGSVVVRPPLERREGRARVGPLLELLHRLEGNLAAGHEVGCAVPDHSHSAQQRAAQAALELVYGRPRHRELDWRTRDRSDTAAPG